MTDQFNTKGHTVEEKEFVSAYLKAGISIAKITQVEFTESKKGTPGAKFYHETKPVEGLEGKGQVADTTWWMSEGAWPYTKDRLTIMADKLEVREALDNISANDSKSYVEGLAKVFVGKAARWKFSGEEVEGKINEETKEKKPNWFKAQLASYGFVEPLTVSDADSKLKFDPSNKYDMVRLKPTDVEPATSQNGTATAQEADDTWS